MSWLKCPRIDSTDLDGLRLLAGLVKRGDLKVSPRVPVRRAGREHRAVTGESVASSRVGMLMPSTSPQVAKSHKIMTRFGRHLSANCCRISTVTLYTTFLHYYLEAG